ncbi:MAG: hypothetical protein KME35_10435 [Aphanocapsa sp. GSE-SYN-MK-11-07L]|jgi:hypothetical protein|nr:hypothetical protein [Aphanocapsa sp. GSE-SYN-MK-11-07L]
MPQLRSLVAFLRTLIQIAATMSAGDRHFYRESLTGGALLAHPQTPAPPIGEKWVQEFSGVLAHPSRRNPTPHLPRQQSAEPKPEQRLFRLQNNLTFGQGRAVLLLNSRP